MVPPQRFQIDHYSELMVPLPESGTRNVLKHIGYLIWIAASPNIVPKWKNMVLKKASGLSVYPKFLSVQTTNGCKYVSKYVDQKGSAAIVILAI